MSGEVVVSNQTVKFSVLDGAMLKVRLEDEGTQFGIVPTLAVDSNDPALSITVFKITEVKPGSETLEELETLTLDELTAVVKPRAEGIDSVKIAGVRASGMSSDDFATVQREAMGLQ